MKNTATKIKIMYPKSEKREALGDLLKLGLAIIPEPSISDPPQACARCVTTTFALGYLEGFGEEVVAKKVTPNFHTLDDLNDWCGDNWVTILASGPAIQ